MPIRDGFDPTPLCLSFSLVMLMSTAALSAGYVRALTRIIPQAGTLCSSLRRRDFNPMNFHLLADALQVLVVARRRASFDDVTDTARLHYRFCQANFVDTGETLHAGGDIHVLPEVVDPVIEPHGNGLASVHTDLKAERP
jgi:hypothetical protein